MYDSMVSLKEIGLQTAHSRFRIHIRTSVRRRVQGALRKSLTFDSVVYVVVSKENHNQKVLLRERKRHTDLSVSSTPYAVLSGMGGG